MNCLHCSAETTNGLALCEACQAAAAVYLEFLPIYFHNLARWRPGRTGSRQVPTSREPSGAFLARHDDEQVDRIERALDEAGVELAYWAKRTADDRPGHHARVIERILLLEAEAAYLLLCAFFDRHLITIATTGWIGEFVNALGIRWRQLGRLTERFVPGWYAGACTLCGNPTYVVPGLTWVTCNGVIGFHPPAKPDEKPKPILCGATTNASDHVDIVLDEARDWVARPMQLAQAVVALVDAEQSVPRLHKRISKWGERGRIKPVQHTTRGYEWDQLLERTVVVDQVVGPKRYRLGDVVSVLAIEGATKARAS